jgi:hypothetical protein
MGQSAPAGGYTESVYRQSVKLVRIPTAPTATTLVRRRKPCKTAHFQAIYPRAVFDVAGDNLPSAVDNQQQYRPREIPANRPVRPLCGRCGRYFTALIGYVLRPHIVTFLPSRPLQSRLERRCSRGEGSRGPWSLTGCREPSKRLLRTSCPGRPGL